jgi:hypothetical protein
MVEVNELPGCQADAFHVGLRHRPRPALADLCAARGIAPVEGGLDGDRADERGAVVQEYPAFHGCLP